MRHASFITVDIVVVMAGCGSTPKHDTQQAARNAGSCLMADVSLNNEVLTVANTGGRPWADLSASLLEGGDGDNSFKYAHRDKVVQGGATITIPLNQFVRDDGLKYDPIKYATQGIFIDTANQGYFATTLGMALNARGMYVNDCNTAPAKP